MVVTPRLKLITAVTILAIIAISVFAIIVYWPAPHPPRSIPCRVNWTLITGPGFTGPYCSPVIRYNSTDDTWSIRDPDDFSKGINYEAILDDPADQMDITYSPDPEIQDNNITLQFLVRNTAGTDISYAEFNVTGRVSRINKKLLPSGYEEVKTSGFPILTDSYLLPVENLTQGEYREIEVSCSLPRPAPQEIHYLRIDLTAPATFIAFDGQTVGINSSNYTIVGLKSFPRTEEELRRAREWQPPEESFRPPDDYVTMVIIGDEVVEYPPEYPPGFYCQ